MSWWCCEELGSSIVTCFVYCFSFFSQSYIFFAAVSHVLFFFRPFLCVVRVSSSFTNSFRSSSHLLAGLPAFLRDLVDMISPGFCSAAFLVHLSGLCVAVRRACRHFSFFCVSTQFVMLCVSMFSSASLAILLMYSTHSSDSFSWLHVLSVSFPNEILLSLVIFKVCAVFFLRIKSSLFFFLYFLLV